MRSSGILLPIFSLPGTYGIGCFSRQAYKFVDFLRDSGQRYWQILPLGPTGYGDSPYQSFSTFAGNPYFIDLERLIAGGLLTREECDSADFGENDERVNYEKLYLARYPLLHKAYERSRIAENPDFRRFQQENVYWLRDYALFMALKDHFGGDGYRKWPEDIRRRYGFAMDYYQRELYYDIEFYEYLQYEFDRQWKKLHTYALEQGLRIIGDIPIYVAPDSADAWAHPELFQVDQDGRPYAIAGCPPDGFSATGQVWGNPLYNWDVNRETGYDWWVRRIAKCRELYDVVRIDHFRGFDEYFSVPEGERTAVHGHWKKGPGLDLFTAIRNRLGDVDIIAEDLGYMTDSVRKLVKDCGFPNMKVLEFAFDSRDSSGPTEYLPHNYSHNCVVYTGTHDNETLLQWLDNILPVEVAMVQEYIGQTVRRQDKLAEMMIRLAHSSIADTCIIPFQDYLGLGAEARINKPSTVGTNWRWRMREDMLGLPIRKKLRYYVNLYGRNY